MKLIVYIGATIVKIKRIINYCIRQYQLSKLKNVGKKVYIGPNCILTPQNIIIGNDVYIGANCVFQSSYGKIYIGDHCMFGPGVNIHGGNHKFREIGKLIKEASKKLDGDDGVIRIGADCWLGANVIVLSNVTIGKGSIIGAGAVVTCDIKPYSIYTGSPVPKERFRFSHEQVTIHEDMLKINKKEN